MTIFRFSDYILYEKKMKACFFSILKVESCFFLLQYSNPYIETYVLGILILASIFEKSKLKKHRPFVGGIDAVEYN